MRNLAALLLATVGFASARDASAESVMLYGQGQGGVSSNDGGPGPTLGIEVGAKILFISGYFSFDDYVDHGTVTRVLVGVGSDIGLGGFRLSGRAGAGLLFENNGAFGMTPPAFDRTGLVARAGAALDYNLMPALWIGAGADVEYFGIKATDDAAPNKDVHTGGDVLFSLHLRFELGI
jgi:hypothetical protein